MPAISITMGYSYTPTSLRNMALYDCRPRNIDNLHMESEGCNKSS